MNTAKKQSHLESLKLRHTELEDAVYSAHRNYSSDAKVTELKREKLRIKDEITALEQEINTSKQQKA